MPACTTSNLIPKIMCYYDIVATTHPPSFQPVSAPSCRGEGIVPLSFLKQSPGGHEFSAQPRGSILPGPIRILPAPVFFWGSILKVEYLPRSTNNPISPVPARLVGRSATEAAFPPIRIDPLCFVEQNSGSFFRRLYSLRFVREAFFAEAIPDPMSRAETRDQSSIRNQQFLPTFPTAGTASRSTSSCTPRRTNSPPSPAPSPPTPASPAGWHRTAPAGAYTGPAVANPPPPRS